MTPEQKARQIIDKKLEQSGSIRVKGDATTYEFEVDCQTGEVVKIDTNMPNINLPGGHGGTPQSGTLPGEHEPNNQNTVIPNSGDGVQNVPSPDENEGEPQQGGMEGEPRTHDDDIPDNDVGNGER